MHSNSVVNIEYTVEIKLMHCKNNTHKIMINLDIQLQLSIAEA